MNSLSSTIYPDGKTFIFYHRRWLDEILQWQDGVLNILNKDRRNGWFYRIKNGLPRYMRF